MIFNHLLEFIPPREIILKKTKIIWDIHGV